MSNQRKKNDGGEDGSKGILKKPDGDQGKGKKSVVSIRKSVRWDELNVTATLHPVGKDYGHEKIVEVPTPFERPRAEDGVGVDPLLLAKRLEEAVRRDSSLSEDSSRDADDERSVDEEARKRSFREKRKEHYREFARLRTSVNTTSDDDDADAANGKRKNRK